MGFTGSRSGAGYIIMIDAERERLQRIALAFRKLFWQSMFALAMAALLWLLVISGKLL
jgi:hypothetical protein